MLKFGKRRITKQTLCVDRESGCAFSIPVGNIIEIPVAPAEGNRTVDVIWDGKKLMMFVSDVMERSWEISP